MVHAAASIPYCHMLAAIAVVAVLGPGCSNGSQPCRIDDAIEDLVAPDAIDCGRVSIGEDPASLDACMLAALEDGLPFQGSYEVQGIDSQAWIAYVVTPEGELWEVTYDSCIGGGPPCDSRITGHPCTSPEAGTRFGRTTVTCETAQPGTYQTLCE